MSVNFIPDFSPFTPLLKMLTPWTDKYRGYPAFFGSIVGIGFLTAIIGDVASHFGCFSQIRDSVTAITIVALGTSVPG